LHAGQHTLHSPHTCWARIRVPVSHSLMFWA
jgi:hypothetical protein